MGLNFSDYELDKGAPFGLFFELELEFFLRQHSAEHDVYRTIESIETDALSSLSSFSSGPDQMSKANFFKRKKL